MRSLSVVLWLLFGSLAPPAHGRVVARLAGTEITEAEVRKHLRGSPTDVTVRVALQAAIDDVLLRAEAKRILQPTDAQRPDAAARLLSHLFSPDNLCQVIPERMRRDHYTDNLWRLRMPPAWRVSAIHWTCCRGDGCDAPDAVACLADGRRAMARLRAELPDRTTDQDFGAAYDARAPSTPRLGFSRYTFFHDPANPDQRIHRRLRQAPPAVAQAVVDLTPGQLAKVVSTRAGHHILRLREARPGVALAWDDPRTQALLRTELCPRFWLRARQQYVTDLRQQLPLQLDSEALRQAFGVSLTPARPRPGPARPSGR